jgi:hypothetical protein
VLQVRQTEGKELLGPIIISSMCPFGQIKSIPTMLHSLSFRRFLDN